jgi:hypothetical protein
MFGSDVLEVAIGLVFVFFLISIMCSAVREGLEAFLKTRASYLEYGIRELLKDTKGEGLASSLYKHPLINGLFSGNYCPGKSESSPSLGGGNLPSYIPSQNFALALMDMAARGPNVDASTSGPSADKVDLASIRANIESLENPYVQRTLLVAIDSAQGDLNKAQAAIEAWYNSSMDRVSGWYKRSTQWIIFAIGLLIAIGLNVDSIKIAEYLRTDHTAREALVARAQTVAAGGTAPATTPPAVGAAGSQTPTTTGPNPNVAQPATNDNVAADKKTSAAFKQTYDDLASLSLPIGWSEENEPWSDKKPFSAGVLLLALGGWLLTALAATMGAPFWFDILNKLIVVRSTVKPQEKSQDEPSKDGARQPIQKQEDTTVTGSLVGVITSSSQQTASPPNSADIESEVDGCSVQVITPTPDEELPQATGGVA